MGKLPEGGGGSHEAWVQKKKGRLGREKRNQKLREGNAKREALK